MRFYSLVILHNPQGFGGPNPDARRTAVEKEFLAAVRPHGPRADLDPCPCVYHLAHAAALSTVDSLRRTLNLPEELAARLLVARHKGERLDGGFSVDTGSAASWRSFLRDAQCDVRRAVERVAKPRADCAACGGSGVGRFNPYATHDTCDLTVGWDGGFDTVSRSVASMDVVGFSYGVPTAVVTVDGRWVAPDPRHREQVFREELARARHLGGCHVAVGDFHT